MNETPPTIPTVERIEADGLYTSADIMRIMHVSRKTVGYWCEIGLEYTPVSLHPKAKRFVTGAALMEFLRSYGAAMRILALMKTGKVEGPED